MRYSGFLPQLLRGFGGIYLYPAGQNPTEIKEPDIPPGRQDSSSASHDPPPRLQQRGSGRETGTEDLYMEFTWPLSGDAVATLSVTKTLDADDIETLEQYFAIAKKALTKAAGNKKAAIAESTSSE